MILLALGAALLVACALELRGLVATALAAYVVLTAELAALTLTLSPFRAATQLGLTVAALGVFLGALVLWLHRGRPRPAAGRLPDVRRLATRGPAVLVLSIGVGVSFAYELLVALRAPPNNWDSLTYHLPRVTSWFQHGGVHWVANATTDRSNEFPALAEQELLALFATTGSDALYAVPQLVALVAVVAGIYGIARGLGEPRGGAAFAALLFATAPLVAVESTTAQNDLVAAALVVSAASFALGTSRREKALAGTAAGLAVAVKLTVLFALPILLLLAARRGLRGLAVFSACGGLIYALLGGWTLVLNLAETGHVLGRGGGRVEHSATPSFSDGAVTLYRIGYHLLDRSGFHDSASTTLAMVAVVVGAAVVAERLWRGRGAPGQLSFAAPTPMLAPLLVVLLAFGVAALGKAVDLPVNDPASTSGAFTWDVNVRVNEDITAFGPLYGLLLVGASAVAIWRNVRTGGDRARLLLGLALPSMLVGLALTSKYNPWMNRFLLVAAALTAPLLAPLWRRRPLSVAIAAVAVVGLALAHVNNELKPLHGAERPWNLDRPTAAGLLFESRLGDAVADLDRIVPPDACVAVVLGGDAPVQLLYGPGLDRHVVYLRSDVSVPDVEAAGVTHVITPAGQEDALRAALESAGWTLGTLGNYWANVSAPESFAAQARPCRGS